MKRSIFVTLSISLLLWPPAWPAAAQQKPNNHPAKDAHPTRLIAKYARGMQPQAEALSMDQHGLTVHKHIPLVPGLVVLESEPLPKGAAKNALPQKGLHARMKALRDSGLFEYVELDYRVHADLTPTDLAYANGTLWGLRSIEADRAWDITTGSSNVIVAVIDTGIRYTHQELATQMWRNLGEIPGNGIDDDDDGFVDNVYGINAITGAGDPFDDHFHGTHVAGTIGAAANDRHEIVGVAWQVRLMACKFLDDEGSGYTSDAIECINFAVAKGAKILNNSWGGGGYSHALYDAIVAARNAGVLFVAAAGNGGFDQIGDDNDALPDYPACYALDNVVSVAALDRFDDLASFSNYGQRSVHLGAPGVSIYSCTAGSDSEYQYLRGTSMATPHVSGVAALIVARYPAITLAELRQRLLNTVVRVPALSGRCVSGGRVNAYNALTATPDGLLEISISTSSTPPLAPDSSVSLYVAVSDLTPVNNARVTGQILDGRTLTFVNNGAPPDMMSGDHIYSATLPVPATGSNFTVQLVVSAPGKQALTNYATFAIRLASPNDMLAKRVAINSSTATVFGANDYATKEPGEPDHAGNPGGKSVWWSWTAPISGSMHLTTDGSSFDTLLGVYTGSSVSGLALVADDDDSGEELNSAVTFAATAGTTYQIAVDGYGGFSGAIQLNLYSLAPLRLLPPERLADGACRIWIASSDDRPLDLSRAAHIEVYACTSADQPIYQWTRLANPLSALNGMLFMEDPMAASLPMRFYRVIERP